MTLDMFFSLKNLCFATGIAFFVLALIFFSIHDGPELGLSAFVVGIGLIVLAGFLTTLNRRSENIVVKAVIIAELNDAKLTKREGYLLVEKSE